ncbi:hypothetical protein GOP47_0006787, partial [Adiantum capillus-veneris]
LHGGAYWRIGSKGCMVLYNRKPKDRSMRPRGAKMGMGLWVYIYIVVVLLNVGRNNIVCGIIEEVPVPAKPAEGAPSPASNRSSLQTYLVHVPANKKPSRFASLHQWHLSLLASALGLSIPSSAEERLLYSYQIAMQGFAALLTATEVRKLRQIASIEVAFEDSNVEILTTRTPAFLSLATSPIGSAAGIWPASKHGADVIIGLLDTGIWPERSSFRDNAGFSPVPPRWKGFCESSPSFNSSRCNRKLIGARTFVRGFKVAASGSLVGFPSPRDSHGHGTHTSSIAAGMFVPDASLSGAAIGTASGMAPHSRIAMYKVCWNSSCFNSDILAGFDAAILDGVDVISVSIGGTIAHPFYKDAIAIGAFSAMAKGIITSCSAGNAGPTLGSTTSVAPWIFSIAASSVDREFPAPVILGNGKQYKGMSFWHTKVKDDPHEQLRLVYAGDVVVPGGNASLARECMSSDVLSSDAIKGKIVLCVDHDGKNEEAKGFAVFKAGGIGMILGNGVSKGEDLTSLSHHILPATLVGHSSVKEILQYIKSTNNPTAHVQFLGTKLGIRPAPMMAAFSSRGPNLIAPDILKPDITAPGVNILAAWTGFQAPSGLAEDRRREVFNIVSGTSMSCPHVAGVTALLKAIHPTWSPAAIRSALMTTAKVTDNTGLAIADAWTGTAADPTAYGAGHIDPSMAFKPGLVYDITTQDYTDFLCSQNYTEAMIGVFVGAGICNRARSPNKAGDLNYPSFSVVYNQNKGNAFEATFTRTLTNVGIASSAYTAIVKSPTNVSVVVMPNKLFFERVGQKISFSITFRAEAQEFVFPQKAALSFGSLAWTDGVHQVRSSISFWRFST